MGHLFIIDTETLQFFPSLAWLFGRDDPVGRDEHKRNDNRNQTAGEREIEVRNKKEN